MATNPSLFGYLGGDEAAMQRQLDEERAVAASKRTLDEQLGYMAAKAGTGIGRTVAGMFGADTTDPVVRKASQVRQLASQFDTTQPEGMMQFAQAVRAIDPNLAVQAAQQAQSMMKTSSEISKNLRERASADPLQQLIRTGKYTPSSVAAYAKSGNIEDLDTVDKADPTALSETADGVFLINKQTGAKIARVGSAPERGNKTIVSVDAKGEAEFTKELGKLDAKRVGDASTVRDTAISSLNSLNKLATLPASALISGQFATGRVGVTNLLATLGLASPSDTKKLAASQEYQKTAGDVILQTLGGKLGSGFSNADREFIAGLVPQLETNPEARRSLIQFMQAKNQDVIKEANRLETYARQNKGLSGFTPAIPMSVTPSGQYSGLSDAELAARIKAAQAKQQR
jgi:hypothetical protein